MPKVKKAAPSKKGSVKKPVAIKKTIAKKRVVKKVTAKKSPLLAKKKLSKKRTPATEDSVLQQALETSVTQLAAHWDKKLKNTQKQVETLRKKQETAAKKLKTAPKKGQQKEKAAALLHTLQTELTETRLAFTTAKQNTQKYAALRKLIAQFEKNWLKEQAEKKTPKAKKTASTPKKQKGQKITPTTTPTLKKTKRNTKKQSKSPLKTDSQATPIEASTDFFDTFEHFEVEPDTATHLHEPASFAEEETETLFDSEIPLFDEEPHHS